MFEARDPHVIWNLTEMLPAQGEERSVSTLQNAELTVDILYDDRSQGCEACIRVVFEDVASVIVSIFPGVEMTRLKCDRNANPGSIVEFRRSKVAREWTAYRYWSSRKTRHFQFFLLEENRRFDVFAEECRLERYADGQPLDAASG